MRILNEAFDLLPCRALVHEGNDFTTFLASSRATVAKSQEYGFGVRKQCVHQLGCIPRELPSNSSDEDIDILRLSPRRTGQRLHR